MISSLTCQNFIQPPCVFDDNGPIMKLLLIINVTLRKSNIQKMVLSKYIPKSYTFFITIFSVTLTKNQEMLQEIQKQKKQTVITVSRSQELGQENARLSQLYIIMMRFWSILAIAAYLVGYYLLVSTPWGLSDPMHEMNIAAAPLLQQLIQTKYFRMIRLNINQECPLGILNRICKSNSCSVCRCDDRDIPQAWTNTDRVRSHTQGVDLWGVQRGEEGGWVWHVQDEGNDVGEYFDIYSNIQSFTNYNGTSIWQLIYNENCFQGSYDQLCSDERILYNIISGLHTSISTHLSRFYKHPTPQQAVWADMRGQGHSQFHFNHSEYQRRVLDHPQRIRNLFFIYRILAKAVKEAAGYLRNNLTIQSDNITSDLQARQLLSLLLKELEGYDLSEKEKENLKFFTRDNPKIKQYQKYIHNISNILNCVECEKCRLFGKMQTYGVGTALKILLGYPTPYKRNEIVALFNVFNKISMSIDTYYKNRKEAIPIGYEQLNLTYIQIYTYIGSFLGLALLMANSKKLEDKVEVEKKNE